MLLALLCSLLLALLMCSLLISLRALSGSSIGSLTKLCCSLLEFSPHIRGTCLGQGRKTKDTSRSVICAAACLGCVSMCRRFWSRAKSCAVLGGTLGENAAWCSSHGSSAQADGCGLSPAAGPARHVVLCGHRSVFSSPPGRRMFRLLAFFHEPSCVCVSMCVDTHTERHSDTCVPRPRHAPTDTPARFRGAGSPSPTLGRTTTTRSRPSLPSTRSCWRKGFLTAHELMSRILRTVTSVRNRMMTEQ